MDHPDATRVHDRARSRPLTGEERLRLWAAGLLAVMLAVHAADLGTRGLLDRTGRLKAPDFLQFYTYGALVAGGQTDALYDPDAHARVARTRTDPRMTLTAFHPNYSPVIGWMMAPLSWLPYLEAMALFAAVSVVLYFGGSVLFVSHVLPSRLTTALFCAAAWPALFIVVRYGQLSTLTLLLLACAVVLDIRGRPWLAGICLGLLAYKPNLLPVPLLVLAISRQWRMVAGLAVGAALETAANFTLVGPDGMREYAGILLNLAQQPEQVQIFPAESHSVRGFVRLLTGSATWATAAAAIAVPASVTAAALVWRRTTSPEPRWAVLVLGALLASPHLLTYDLLLAGVPLMLLAAWLLQNPCPLQERRRVIVALAVLAAGAWPGPLIARLTAIQISTLAMAFLLGWLVRVSRKPPGPSRAAQ